ncbi:hypothetical protein GIB67_031644 [Kingdonia uniflora]|uniref:Uncharacterized protein n=1 Tax=Kingdonia uniflora TaxID=39325 RepID=A0A7J7LYG2_9MAGN|nr:hypothetical protein GIB67_031644 [Kingdonia uniflora]
MRLVILFLVFCMIFFCQTQGIRLKQEFMSTEAEVSDESGVGMVVLCQDGCCSGRSRKLLTQNIPSSTARKEGEKVDHTSSNKAELKVKEEELSVKPTPVSKHREPVPERYPDIIDIAGMDYSPAKRKPPIHN